MTDLMTIMRNRHSVKSYTDEPISPEVVKRLQEEIDAVNEIGNLHFQLVLDEPRAFTGFWTAFQNFKNVRNYLILAGPNSERLDEQCGHFGEHLVLIAQSLGLNSCWAGLGFSRRKARYDLKDGERCAIAVALGHGVNAGAAHKMKDASEVSNLTSDSPEWFRRGIEAMLLAPTVMDEQETTIDLLDDYNKNGKRYVRSSTTGKGHFAYVDYGIARYHFEAIAGTENFAWG